MKLLSHILRLLPAVLLTASCTADMALETSGTGDAPGSSNLFTAIVTVKKSPSDTVYFQLNDSVTVYPVNYQGKYSAMERVICEARVKNAATGSYPCTCYVNWLEALDTGIVTSDKSIKGDDGIDIIEDWMTSVEDGYLTLHYTCWWGTAPVQHSFILVTGTNPSDPYEVELRHNAGGDGKDTKGDSLVCFDINSLPDTGGSYKTLTLKWTTSGGSASEKAFRFKTRE